jgi:uncharacterized RDD family membrane protein YckC
MPQGGEPGSPRDTGPQAAAAGQQWESAPGQGPPGSDGGGQSGPGQPGGAPQGGSGQGGTPPPPPGQPPYGQPQPQPGQQPYGQPQYGTQQYGQPQYGNAPGGQYPPPGQPGGGPMMGMPISPVNEAETRVTGRRVVQYIIDYIITGAIASLIFWALDRGHGAVNAVLILIAVVIDLAWYFWYWVLRPYQANGQSFGMQLLGLRVISRDGGPASMMQLFIRGILLIIDTLIWGLVGFITIICSRYRQRVGDHAAKTLVVRSSVEPIRAPREFAGAGQAGTR